MSDGPRIRFIESDPRTRARRIRNGRRIRNVRFVNPERVVRRRINRFIQNPEQEELNIRFNRGITMNESINILINSLQRLINLDGERFLLIADDNFYTLSERSLFNLRQTLQNQIFLEREQFGSDEQVLAEINRLNNFTISRLPEGRERVGGAFFKYINKTDIKLDKYGIHSEINKENYKDCCLVIALREAGMKRNKLDILKTMIFYEVIPKCKLNEICKRLDIMIKLKSHTTTSTEDKIRVYGNNKNEVYDIGCLEGHYFINDKTEYTKYSIINYSKVKYVDNWNKIYGINSNGSYMKTSNRYMNSYQLIKNMLENKELFFEKISYSKEILETQFSDKFIEIESLEYDESQVKPV